MSSVLCSTPTVDVLWIGGDLHNIARFLGGVLISEGLGCSEWSQGSLEPIGLQQTWIILKCLSGWGWRAQHKNKDGTYCCLSRWQREDSRAQSVIIPVYNLNFLFGKQLQFHDHRHQTPNTNKPECCPKWIFSWWKSRLAWIPNWIDMNNVYWPQVLVTFQREDRTSKQWSC